MHEAPSPPAPCRRHRRQPTRLAGVLLVGAVLALPACGDDGAAPEGPSVVARDVFVETYVELREAALLHGGEVSDSLREVILARHGVTAEELLRFAEVRGTDVGFMQEVWAEVEARLEERRVPMDSLELGNP